MNTTAELQWGLDKIGTPTEPKEFEVTKERIAAYAEATNDEHPTHVSGELAPPVFAIVPAFESMVPSMVGIVPNEVLMRGVHGEQDFRYHQPIVPGQTLVSRGAPVGVHGTVQRCAPGQGETRETQVRRARRRAVHDLVRPRRAARRRARASPCPSTASRRRCAAREPLASVAQGYDADQTQRYSEASGDPMPIHLDEDFAKAMGLPGIIVHGLCTMAFTSRAVDPDCLPRGPGARCKRLAVRFAKIVQPSETVTTSLWDAGTTDDGARRLAFETVSDNGNVGHQGWPRGGGVD